MHAQSPEEGKSLGGGSHATTFNRSWKHKSLAQRQTRTMTTSLPSPSEDHQLPPGAELERHPLRSGATH